MAASSSARVLRLAAAAALALGGAAAGLLPSVTSAAASTRAAGDTPAAAAQRGLSPDTRFFVPPPSSGAPQQIVQLLKHGDTRDAALIGEMEAIPRAVWFDSGTPAQVQQQVQRTMAEAAVERATPVLVAYDIPGRDCAQYSAGGALSQADYQAWSTLEQDPGAHVYLDGTHSAWQSVGTMTQRLLAANVQEAQGFFLNVSNYQPDPQLQDYGTWISDCIAMVTDSANALYGNPAGCGSQYYPATESDFSTWNLTTQWYAQNMGDAVAATHFVIDTSRNGDGPDSMQQYAGPPYDQPASVVTTLAAGNWCNPPGSGLGLRPTARTGVPLLDAYLWVKTPGQSDGQCDSAGGARAWDYTDYSQPGWPTTAADQSLFDPLWGIDDPAAGAWFPQQALQLAQLASPSLPGI
jgi:endoglucanase